MPRLTPVVLLTIAITFSLGCGSRTGDCLPPPEAASSASSNNTCVCSGSACPIQFNAFVYAAGANSQLAAFPLDLATGALETPVTTAGPAASPGMAVIGNQLLYASSQLPNGGAVDGWSIDPATGTLTAISGTPFSLGATSVPGGIVAASNLASPGPYLYVADAGTIDALEVTGPEYGSLITVPGSPFTSGTNQYLAIDYMNRFVFAADEDPPGGVLAFTINASTGALTLVPSSPFALIPNLNVKVGQIVVDPTSSFVYVTIQSTNQVAAFSITPSSGALTPVPGSPFAAGGNASAITTFNNSPSNNFLYVSNQTDGTISGYSISPTTGVLSPLAGSPFSISAEVITTDISGGHLFASSANGVTVYSINPASGSLTQIGSPITFAGATTLAFVGP